MSWLVDCVGDKGSNKVKFILCSCVLLKDLFVEDRMKNVWL